MLLLVLNVIDTDVSRGRCDGYYYHHDIRFNNEIVTYAAIANTGIFSFTIHDVVFKTSCLFIFSACFSPPNGPIIITNIFLLLLYHLSIEEMDTIVECINGIVSE